MPDTLDPRPPSSSTTAPAPRSAPDDDTRSPRSVTPPPRVSPFALPASTTSQFLLLVTLVATVAAFTWDQPFGGPSFWQDDFRACVIDGNADASSRSALATTVEYLDCVNGVLRLRGWAELFGIVAVLAATSLGTAVLPRLLVRREGLVAFEPRDFPRVAADIERCVAEAGLAQAPRWFYEPFRSDRGGRAFGTNRRPRVRLALTQLVSEDEGDRAVLRAVVRHELAHVRNRDLTITAVVVVAPVVFVAVVAVPLMATLALRSPSELWAYGWRLAAMLVLLLLVRASVFRMREHYADVRASGTGPGGARPFPTAAFRDLPVPPQPVVATMRAVAALWRPHPSSAVRLAVVGHPDRLLVPGFGEGTATGLTAGIVFAFLRNTATTLLNANPVYAVATAGVAVGLLVATVTGQSMWRAALAAAATARRPPAGVTTASGLALGLLLAEFVTPGALISWAWLVRIDPLSAAAAAALLLIACLAFTRWCSVTATSWLGATRAPTLRRALVLGLGCAAPAFGALYGIWSLAVSIATRAPSVPELAVRLLNPFFLLPIVVAMVLPLAAAWSARRGRPVEREILLDAPHHAVLPAPRMRPALVLVPPLVVAAVYLVVDVANGGLGMLTILQWGGASAAVVAREELVVQQVHALIVFLAAVEALVVLVVAVGLARGPVLARWAHLFAAALATGALLSLAVLAAPLVSFCRIGECRVEYVTWVGTLCVASATIAPVVVLPVWVLGAALGRLRRLPAVLRARSWTPWRPPVVPQPPLRPHRRLTRVVGVATAALAVVFASTTLVLQLELAGALQGARGVVQPDVRDAPADRRPTTTAASCGAYNASGQRVRVLEVDTIEQLQIARALRANTEDAILRSAGEVKEQAILEGDRRRQLLADNALMHLCPARPVLTPPP